MDVVKQMALLYVCQIRYEYKDGNLYKRKNGKQVKVYKTPQGYLQYHLSLGHQEQMHIFQHNVRYIMEYGIYDPKYVIGHKNHIRDDNDIENLECITQQKNVMDSMHYKKEHPMKGKAMERIIYPPDIRRKVKELRDAGMSFTKIGKQFDMARQTASRIYKEDVGSVPYYL